MPKRTTPEQRRRERQCHFGKPLTVEQEVVLFLARAIGSRVDRHRDDLSAAFPGATEDQIGDGIVMAMKGVHDEPDHRVDEVYDPDFDPPVPKKVGPQ